MQQSIATTSASSRSKRWLVFLLLAFMWMQFAGTLHKLAHAHHEAGAGTSSPSLDALFPSHSQENKQDCQLLDLQCGGAALVQLKPLLALPVLALQVASAGNHLLLTSPALVYQARAPPPTSI